MDTIDGIIPLREKIGNYNIPPMVVPVMLNYTTTRENWELQRGIGSTFQQPDYTTTRENWELQLALETVQRR